jgi:general secretion pathway protein C
LFETIISKGAEPMKWLLVAGIAYTLATGIWSFFETPVSTVADRPAASLDTSKPRAPANVNWILSKHLFGEAGSAPVDQGDASEPAVQTRLPLELQSVFVADDASASAAIVAQRGKPGKLYAIGDNLPGNAKLVEVATDRIILRRAGVRETLMFPKGGAQLVASPVEPREAQPTTAPEVRSDAQQRGQASATSPRRGEAQNAADVVEQYQTRLSEDAQGTLNELGIESVEATGAGGYRIGDVSSSPYLRQTGLQPGDVVLSVNGRPVGDIQQDRLELENIMAQGSARIEVQRGTRRFFITASLK